MPRVEATRALVAGLVELIDRRPEAALACFAPILAVAPMIEVGFEALAPAWAALAGHAASVHVDGWLALAERSLAEAEHPGLAVTLAIVRAACSSAPMPTVDPTVAASSSDVRRALRLVSRLATREHLEPSTLTIASRGRRARLPDGTVLDLMRRAAVRRILVVLAEAHGEPSSADTLIAAGWPGERMRADAARQRLRTAIWTLRRLGFEHLLRTSDEGYLLDPSLAIAWADEL
jgi:hypothetical protein